MNLRTFTGLWKIERRLYKLYDITLPYPVSLRQLAIFLGIGIPWIAILSLTGFPLETPWHVVWIAPPVIATIIGNRPIAEGKTPFTWLFTQYKYVTGAHEFTRLAPASPLPYIHLRGRVWSRTDR
jgi:hypothetical protein